MLDVRNNNILVEILEEETSNIFIPPVFKAGMADCKIGKVFDHGPKAKVSIGATVLFGKWQGEEVVYQGKRLSVIKPQAIAAIK